MRALKVTESLHVSYTSGNCFAMAHVVLFAMRVDAKELTGDVALNGIDPRGSVQCMCCMCLMCAT